MGSVETGTVERMTEQAAVLRRENQPGPAEQQLRTATARGRDPSHFALSPRKHPWGVTTPGNPGELQSRGIGQRWPGSASTPS